MAELNALIPLSVRGPEWNLGNSLAQGAEFGNALLDAPIKRKLMQAQAEYYGDRAQLGGASVYGTPIYGTDPATGETVLGAIGKDGSFQRLDTGGVVPTPGLQFLNRGTDFLPVDKRTGAPSQPIPIDAAGEAQAKQQGERQGQAVADLPKAESSAERLLSQVQDVQEEPRLGNVTGWQGYLPTLNPENVNVETKIQQLGGGAFLQAFESLKGGGQITEAEGKKATEALARITNLKQSDQGFVQALDDFKGEVVRLRDLARTRAGGDGTPAPTGGAGGPQYNLPPGISFQQLQQWVQEATQAGVPEEKIKAKMREMGIDPDQ